MNKKVPPQLLQLLSDYYPDSQRARIFINLLDIPTDYLDFSGAPKTMWFGILSEARKHVGFHTIFSLLKEEYPNQDWDSVESLILADTTVESPFAIPSNLWKGNTSTRDLEKIIGNQSTLLPISFLEAGVQASKSVAKINIPTVGCGSGFLIANNILLTNNHVLEDVDTASRSEAVFNFQLNLDGKEAISESFTLAPRDLFITDEHDDWTAVRVNGDANSKWGKLQMERSQIKKGESVNIIQHPGGHHKQIALYHNLVQYVDKSCIQYLTDTMNGSSGSPVFNSDWNVVALHRAGGMLREPNSPSARQYFRNEGTPIQIIYEKLLVSGAIT